MSGTKNGSKSSDFYEVKLRNGIYMPYLGLGTSHSGGFSHSAVVFSLKHCGYRLIDTAKRYGCEDLLSVAIKESGVPRKDLFLTTKLWPTDYGREKARKSFFGSLQRLDTEYVDLYMLHWPYCPSKCENREELILETWRTLESLYDQGFCRAIGVSNFQEEHLELLLKHCSIFPHVNQVEFHPYQNPVQLKHYCRERDIQLEGYCPLGKGQLLHEPAIQQVASQCRRTPAQILIRWSIQSGVVTIPKSTKPDRVKENSQVFDFKLTEGHMNQLNKLHDGRRIVDISTVQERIDSKMPDGYKLNLHTDVLNYNFHSEFP